MCRFKNWYSDENGYVIQCEDCRHFQLSFGTTMLTMEELQYQKFTQTVIRKKEIQEVMQDSNCKCIILPTHSELVHVILSFNELEKLNEMLQVVDTELRTSELMDLF